MTRYYKLRDDLFYIDYGENGLFSPSLPSDKEITYTPSKREYELISKLIKANGGIVSHENLGLIQDDRKWIYNLNSSMPTSGSIIYAKRGVGYSIIFPTEVDESGNELLAKTRASNSIIPSISKDEFSYFGSDPKKLTLFGRERELQKMLNWAENDISFTRIMSLTGPLGVGKSRLCLEMCLILEDRGWSTVWFDNRFEEESVEKMLDEQLNIPHRNLFLVVDDVQLCMDFFENTVLPKFMSAKTSSVPHHVRIITTSKTKPELNSALSISLEEMILSGLASEDFKEIIKRHLAVHDPTVSDRANDIAQEILERLEELSIKNSLPLFAVWLAEAYMKNEPFENWGSYIEENNKRIDKEQKKRIEQITQPDQSPRKPCLFKATDDIATYPEDDISFFGHDPENLKLFGREKELKKISDWAYDLGSDCPTTMSIIGPKGIGKSRLCFELCRNLENQEKNSWNTIWVDSFYDSTEQTLNKIRRFEESANENLLMVLDDAQFSIGFLSNCEQIARSSSSNFKIITTSDLKLEHIGHSNRSRSENLYLKPVPENSLIQVIKSYVSYLKTSYTSESDENIAKSIIAKLEELSVKDDALLYAIWITEAYMHGEDISSWSTTEDILKNVIEREVKRIKKSMSDTIEEYDAEYYINTIWLLRVISTMTASLYLKDIRSLVSDINIHSSMPDIDYNSIIRLIRKCNYLDDENRVLPIKPDLLGEHTCFDILIHLETDLFNIVLKHILSQGKNYSIEYVYHTVQRSENFSAFENLEDNEMRKADCLLFIKDLYDALSFKAFKSCTYYIVEQLKSNRFTTQYFYSFSSSDKTIKDLSYKIIPKIMAEGIDNMPDIRSFASSHAGSFLEKALGNSLIRRTLQHVKELGIPFLSDNLIIKQEWDSIFSDDHGFLTLLCEAARLFENHLDLDRILDPFEAEAMELLNSLDVAWNKIIDLFKQTKTVLNDNNVEPELDNEFYSAFFDQFKVICKGYESVLVFGCITDWFLRELFLGLMDRALETIRDYIPLAINKKPLDKREGLTDSTVIIHSPHNKETHLLSYDGEIMFGMAHGRGTAVWEDGSLYNGEFKYGFRHGKGKYTWSNNDSYEGEWQMGNPNGIGLMIWNDGAKYNGNLFKGYRHGMGELITPTKEINLTNHWLFNYDYLYFEVIIERPDDYDLKYFMKALEVMEKYVIERVDYKFSFLNLTFDPKKAIKEPNTIELLDNYDCELELSECVCTDWEMIPSEYANIDFSFLREQTRL